MVAESRDGAARARRRQERNGQAQARLACDLTGRRPLAGRAAPAGRAPHDLAQAGAGHSRADGVMPCGNVDKTSTIGIFPAPNVRPHAGRHARARLPFPIPRSTRMNLPARVVDLHTHLFNARYLPLESVIASAMKKRRKHARGLRRAAAVRTGRFLVCGRPGSARGPSAAVHARGRGRALSGADLGRRPRRPDGAGARRHDRRAQPGGPADQPWDDAPAEPGLSEELVGIIDQLASIDYAAEGWIDPDPLPLHEPVTSFRNWAPRHGSSTCLVGPGA